MKKFDILKKIPYRKVTTEHESIDLYSLGNFNGSTYELIELPKGYAAKPHIHKYSEATLHFIFGSGKILIGNKWSDYKKEDTFFIPKDTKHGFKVDEDSLFLSVNTPGIIDKKTGKVDVEY